jgi:hypothetical protein
MRTRREQLIIEVTDRLHPVCGSLPPDAFADLVLRVVDVTMKYEAAGTRPSDRRHARRSAFEPEVQ